MRGGAQVKEALGFVTLLWNHPVLTGMLLLIFTPPFFPLVVYFSPLLMSTALCVVALVSVGSQMEKIKAEGGPGQLENHLGRDQGVSRWAPRDHSSRPGNESLGGHHYGRGGESHRNLYASSGINVNVMPAPSSWTEEQENTTTTRATAQLRPEHPPTLAAADSDEDWWDTWVKEYESRPGWGDADDQAFRTPAIPTSATPAIPTLTPAREVAPSMAPLKPPKSEIRDETRSTAPVPAPIPAPVAATVAAPAVSVSVVNRQEASRLLPPPPTTSTSRTSEEVVVSVKVTDYQPHISTLAPIRTGREKRDVRQVDRIAKTPQEILLQAVPMKVDVAERVSDVQALQSIEKLLHMEMGGSATTPPTSLPRNAAPGSENSGGRMPPPAKVVVPGKGIAVEASEKNRNKIAGVGAPPPLPDHDIAGETPLLRHLKTSRSEKQSRSSSAYSPLPLRASRSLMSEKVLPPPQFSPRLLQSLQPLPPKGVSPRPLPNLSTVPLGNPVEKIPQWVYDGIPKEKAEKQAMKAETAEEKHVRAFEQAVKVLSYTRRRTHARHPAPVQVDTANLQGRQGLSTPSTPGLPPVVASKSLHTRISEDAAAERAHGAGDPHGNSAADSTDRASATLSTHRASTIFSPRISISAASPRVSVVAASPPKASIAAASPQQASRASSPQKASMVAASPQQGSRASSPRPAAVASSPPKAPIAASPRPTSRASSPQTASIAASPRPAASPQSASIAASPRPAASHQTASIAASPRPAASHQTASMVAASPRPASSPPEAPIAASPRRASRASSPSIGSSPWPAASITASPRIPSVPSTSPQKPSPPIAARPTMASSPHRSSVPSSPSMPHPRRRRHSSKQCTDKVALPSPRIEGSKYYDAPGEESEKDNLAEEYVPIEREVQVLVKDSNCGESLDNPAEEFPEEGAQLHWGRSYSSRRFSNSRRRLEPRRVVTSQDTDNMFCLKKSSSMRNGQTIKFVESSTTDDERESVTPRASRRSMGRTIKPLVWRSRSVQAHEDSD